MDTRFLESFAAVADCGSIAEAARRLDLTPAGVARRLRALEIEMGTRLVSRSGRTVRPTEAGVAILARSKQYLDVVRDLKWTASEGSVRGELRLGAVQTALTGIVPDVLSLLIKNHPQIEVHIARDTSAELYRRVLNGNLDAAVTSPPSFAIPKTCDWRVFAKNRLLF